MAVFGVGALGAGATAGSATAGAAAATTAATATGVTLAGGGTGVLVGGGSLVGAGGAVTGAAGVSAGITASQIGLGLSALSTGTSVFQSVRQNQAATQEAKASNIYANLEAAQTEKESQQRLASVISMNNNYAAAIGLNPNAGSLLQISRQAERAAESDQLGALSRQILAQNRTSNALFANRSQALGGALGGVADFGKNAFDVFTEA